MDKKGAKPWLLLGAVIYGLAIVNGIRFVRVLPTWALGLGLLINVLMFLGFVKLYKSS
jgi:hypothetical protein